MYKIIVFDVDGTIIDTERATLMALQEVLKEDLGKEVPEEELAVFLGIPGIYVVNHFEFIDPASSLKKWVQHMDRLRGHNQIFDGISELLSIIENRGLRLGIVTSRTRLECDQDPLLKNMMGQFECIITADDTVQHKPSGAPLIKLLDLMKVDAADVLYIGDTVYDLQCAREANIDFIWAGWGSKHDVESFEGPVAMHPVNLSNFIGHRV
ncbi:MAG: HAD family hydrolase [Clostridia bacterium]|nr:HAD family hydrolase [Clostridia bacterium]